MLSANTSRHLQQRSLQIQPEQAGGVSSKSCEHRSAASCKMPAQTNKQCQQTSSLHHQQHDHAYPGSNAHTEQLGNQSVPSSIAARAWSYLEVMLVTASTSCEHLPGSRSPCSNARQACKLPARHCACTAALAGWRLGPQMGGDPAASCTSGEAGACRTAAAGEVGQHRSHMGAEAWSSLGHTSMRAPKWQVQSMACLSLQVPLVPAGLHEQGRLLSLPEPSTQDQRLHPPKQPGVSCAATPHSTCCCRGAALHCLVGHLQGWHGRAGTGPPVPVPTPTCNHSCKQQAWAAVQQAGPASAIRTPLRQSPARCVGPAEPAHLQACALRCMAVRAGLQSPFGAQEQLGSLVLGQRRVAGQPRPRALQIALLLTGLLGSLVCCQLLRPLQPNLVDTGVLSVCGHPRLPTIRVCGGWVGHLQRGV